MQSHELELLGPGTSVNLFRDRPSAGMTAEPDASPRRPMTGDDAVDIWIARWLRVRPKHLVARYGCDPRRLYEIWEETRFPGSRAKALALLRERCPYLEARIDPGAHRRISFAPDPRQLILFPEPAEAP